MTQALICERCQKSIPADAPHGSCPACLLALALGDTPDESRALTAAGSVALATVTASGSSDSRDPDATLSRGDDTDFELKDWPRVEGYRILGVLGEGGNGQVYRAEQVLARREVALKVLHGTSRSDRERILREARALGRLTHANVVTIYDVGETAEGPYFTMEYMRRGTLSQRIKEHPPTPLEAAKYAEAVARGIEAAHAQGIKHRDLKPSNVLIADDGTPKVSDFGLAKLDEADPDASLEYRTPTGAFLGTPGYMAVEQAAGKLGEIDNRTDVYGLGAVLYHCLTGRPPFKGNSPPETMHRVLHDELVPPRSLNRAVPLDLEAVCLRCLEKQKEARYDSAQVVAEELGRVLNGQMTIVRPLGWGGRQLRRVRRNRRGIIQASLVAAMLATVAVTVALLKQPKTPVDPMAEARKQLANDLAMGEPVSLIGGKGPPRWYEWKQREVPFAESPYHDGPCSFVAIEQSRLELVPRDLVPAAYDLEGEVRHDEAGRGQQAIGLYFNDHLWEEGEGYRATARYEVSFNEFAQPPPAPPNQPPPNVTMRVFSLGFRERPGAFDGVPNTTVALHAFRPAQLGIPHVWRRFRVQVRPQSLRVSIRENEQWVDFEPGLVRRGIIDNQSKAIATLMFPERRAMPEFNRPTWEPPGSVGVFTTNGQGSFQNVTITPIRNP